VVVKSVEAHGSTERKRVGDWYAVSGDQVNGVSKFSRRCAV
jgi:hypothetical protein